MNFLNKISIISKNVILLSVVAIGFIAITFISYKSMNIIKNRLDIVYFGNIIPATNLITISDMYSYNILNTIHQYQNSTIDANSAKTKILDAKEVIYNSWGEYTALYQTAKEKEISDYASEKIEISIKTVDTLIYFLESDNKAKIEELAKNELYPNIEPVVGIIDKLTAYEFSLAAHEKIIANDTYANTIKMLFLTLFIVFFLTAIIFFFIVTNIHQNDARLKELNAKLTNISITDTLTQIYNRRYFDIIFLRELQRVRRKKETLCFAMIDIDFFKLYNDNYGHQAGDEALKEVSKNLKSNLKRPSDYLFRLGGEEFAILISDVDEDGAKEFFENTKNSIKKLQIKHEKNPQGIVTISMGVILLHPASECDKETIIKKADDLLYVAKKAGRDMVVFENL